MFADQLCYTSLLSLQFHLCVPTRCERNSRVGYEWHEEYTPSRACEQLLTYDKYLWIVLVCSLVCMSNGWCMVNTCNYINPQVKLLSSFEYLFMFPLCYTVQITHKCSAIQVSFSSQACVLLGTRVHVCSRVWPDCIHVWILHACLRMVVHTHVYYFTK